MLQWQCWRVVLSDKVPVNPQWSLCASVLSQQRFTLGLEGFALNLMSFRAGLIVFGFVQESDLRAAAGAEGTSVVVDVVLWRVFFMDVPA